MRKFNKKGFFQDFLFFIVAALVISIIIVIGSKLLTSVNTNYQATDAHTTAKEIISDNQGRYSVIFDWIFLGMFIFMALAIIVGFFMIDTNPVLFFAIVVVFGFILIVAGIISNSYQTFEDTPSISTDAAKFDVMGFIMNNLIALLLGFGFMGVVVLFAKLKGFFQ